jgi:peptide/nickel transport system permease protein
VKILLVLENAMGRYVTRRLLQTIPLLIGITFVVFMVMNAVPGGPLSVYENNPKITPEDLIRLREKYGLDTPAPLRYLTWVSDFMRGDWGFSKITKQPVTDVIFAKLGNTFLLMGTAFLVSLLIAFPIAVLAARYQRTWFDYLTTTFSVAGFSLPIFWTGLLAILIFSVGLGWFPTGGMSSLGISDSFDLGDRIWHMILPVSVLAINAIGSYVRYIRAGMIEVLEQDYIRTAKSKGLAGGKVFWVHALKNAAIPIVTIVALDLPALFTGALITETIFSWPGMGRQFWESANRFDYPVLMGIVTIAAALTIIFNLLADVLYGILDPRIRYK